MPRPRRQPPRERMSGIDAAWWHMSRPHNPLVIVGVLQLDAAPTLKALRECMDTRLGGERRWRQRPVRDADGDHWEADPRFRIERHVTRLPLPADADGAARRALIGRLASEPLAPEHPLWQLVMVKAGKGATLVLRIHHCYADGAALVRLLQAITDESAAGSAAAAVATEPLAPEAEVGVLEELARLFTDAERAVVPPPAEGHGPVPPMAARVARVAVALGREAVRLTDMPDETPTPLKGCDGPDKAVAWSAPLALADLRPVARAFGCSVHALMLSCVAAALAGELRSRGQDPRRAELRLLVPTPLARTRRAQASAGNHFGLVNLALPLGIANPVARSWEVQRRLEALTGSHQALLMHVLLSLVGLLTEPWRTKALDLLLAGKATGVATTVPGPPAARYLAGARIADMMFWVPQAGDIGLGVSFLSYDGSLRVGVMSDAARLPEPQRLVERLVDEFERLRPLARLMSTQD